MSKVITIPTNRNPFEIMVNNRSYSYQAGASIEVPDEAANAIENALALEPKPERYVTKIGRIAEDSLEEITLEDLEGISAISNCAFYSCKSIKKVTIPNSVTTIGNNAFDWCAALNEIYLPEVPPVITNSNVFGTVTIEDRTFYCKTQESLDAYLSASIWGDVFALAKVAVKA